MPDFLSALWEAANPKIKPFPVPGTELPTGPSIGTAPHTGLLDLVRNWYGANIPESIKNAADNIMTLGSMLGAGDPASVLGSGVPASAGAIIPKIESEAQPFFSGLRKLAESKLGNIVEGQQAKNTLQKLSTADEWANSKLESALEAGKKYQKQDILNKIDNATPDLQDVIFGEDVNKWAKRQTDAKELTGADAYKETQFHQYQEPGGKNYKELFVTDSSIPTRPTYNAWLKQKGLDNRQLTNKELEDTLAEHAAIPTGWEDGHLQYSNVKNPIVRLRFNDRTGPNGEKILFLEEMQPPSAENQKKMPPELIKRWREIGMKRAIKYATDNGYDKVAWTPGQIQADRYGISSKINSFQVKPSVTKNGHNRYLINLDRPNAEPTWVKVDSDGIIMDTNESAWGDKYLAEVIGKEWSQKLLGTTKTTTYSTQGLEIGGEGLKKIYDQDLPNVAKKLGAKVDSVELPIGKQPTQLGGIPYRYPMGTKVPSIDVAPLREKAKSGFSIYSALPVAGAAGLTALQAEKLKKKAGQ